MEILLEFSGGLDTLTINQIKELKLKLKCVDGIDVNLGHLIAYIRRVIIGSKKDLFSYMPIINGNDLNFIDIECDLDIFNGKLNINESCKIRPGVLVLVDDIDWELLGTENHKLIDKQNITFISTLHGG